jgi:GxxExxY protein
MLKGDSTVSEAVIQCAIEVHRCLGPGLLESVYESALCLELAAAHISYARQVSVPLHYKGHMISEHRPDLVVEDTLVVEVKSVARLEPVHTAQLLTYLRVTNKGVGLLLNFNTAVMRHGIRRILLNRSAG